MSSAIDVPAAPDRCASAHWSLPAQCVLPPSHISSWHEAWHPETANRIRYWRSARRTEELRDGEWCDLGPRAGQDPDAYRRRLKADIEDARKALVNARTHYDRLCGELAAFDREQREASRG